LLFLSGLGGFWGFFWGWGCYFVGGVWGLGVRLLKF
jgi:hypothetical protein